MVLPAAGGSNARRRMLTHLALAALKAALFLTLAGNTEPLPEVFGSGIAG